MVKFNSTSRLSAISRRVILTQTDTTVGFLSQDAQRLREIKSRADAKPFITVYKSFQALKAAGIRLPNREKSAIRRAKKTTFIVKNRAFRVAQDTLDSSILRTTVWNYSTSANESGKNFSLSFCEAKADIIVQNRDGLFEGSASRLIKLNNHTKERLR